MSSAFTAHGLPIMGIGLTTWREFINAGFLLLDGGIHKRGDFADRPSLSGETTPGQWYFADDVGALFYDAGSEWQLVASNAYRLLATSADDAEDLTEYDRFVDINPSGEALTLAAGSGAAHKGQLLTVRRSAVGGSNVAAVSGTMGGGSTTLGLPNVGDHLTLLSNGSEWVLVHDGRGFSTQEQWTGRFFSGSKVYRKGVSLASGMPNNNTATTSHGISGLATLLDVRGSASDGATTFPLPFPGHGLNASIAVFVDSSNVSLGSTGNYTSYSTARVVLEYTKG